MTTESEALHRLVHLHFLAAGYLFAYSIAGPDPAPHRPSVPARLVILGVAIAAHALLAQLLYAGLFVQVPVPGAELRGAARADALQRRHRRTAARLGPGQHLAAAAHNL